MIPNLSIPLSAMKDGRCTGTSAATSQAGGEVTGLQRKRCYGDRMIGLANLPANVGRIFAYHTYIEVQITLPVSNVALCRKVRGWG